MGHQGQGEKAVTAGGYFPPGAPIPPGGTRGPNFPAVDAAVTALLYHLMDHYPDEAGSLAAGCNIRIQSGDGKSDHVFQIWLKE
jgi:hypothetical protein